MRNRFNIMNYTNYYFRMYDCGKFKSWRRRNLDFQVNYYKGYVQICRLSYPIVVRFYINLWGVAVLELDCHPDHSKGPYYAPCAYP